MVGSIIREVRKRKGFTLKDLAEKSGLSISQLSRIENGKAKLTVELTLKLADVFNVPATSLLSQPSTPARGRRSLTRAEQGVLHHGGLGIKFEVLCSDFSDKQSLFWRVTVTAKNFEESGGWRTHTGEEFLHVLSGSLELHSIHYDPVMLNPGDSIVFDGEMKHAYVSLGINPAILIMSNSVLQTSFPE